MRRSRIQSPCVQSLSGCCHGMSLATVSFLPKSPSKLDSALKLLG